MNDNVIAFRTALQNPNMDKLLGAASAYSGFWEKRTFDFLPLLHTSIERHYKGFIKYVEELDKNSEALAVTIRSEDIEQLLRDLKGSMEAPDEAEFLLEEIQHSVANIGKKIDVMLAGVEIASKSIVSLPTYDASLDKAGYLKTQERVASDLQVQTGVLAGKRSELAELEKVIEVFEANGIEKLFKGKLPTLEQAQAMFATAATPAGAVLAVGQAVEALNELMGSIQEGMRYSQLHNLRRSLQTQVKEMVAEQRDQEQRAHQLVNNLNALSEYAPLIEKRSEWLAEMNQIRVNLEGVRNQFRSIKVEGVESIQALNKLLAALLVYASYVVAEFKKSF
ncbi:alpha-xenorhabdolysin family binary toxin subunit B [Pseudomonas sp. BBP2017]|uniref:alpha-xenorhabdolysin family binary toxin subunit B n=1 Tax=Pseudomonas sp. BBP2017 TaxID=2109731 RepID=UPI000D12B453|nr:alpha-xenorhabdolysin family binary toxin subunit B [Pseudomonas sp. BBP2017]PSS57080.1 hypothetical protein C6382_11365 [Pseudomonas sp. BBP2017]